MRYFSAEMLSFGYTLASLMILQGADALPVRRSLIARQQNSNFPSTTTATPFLGLVAVAVLVPLTLIVLGLCAYRHKRALLKPTVGVPVNPMAVPTPRRSRRGVWRAEQPEEGLPSYTMQPTTGELSLGVGRKRSEPELEHRTSGDTSDNGDATTRVEAPSQETAEVPVVVRNPTEELPPYIPPPRPAVVKDENGVARLASATQATRVSSNVSGETV